jgi:hypothetical protein
MRDGARGVEAADEVRPARAERVVKSARGYETPPHEIEPDRAFSLRVFDRVWQRRTPGRSGRHSKPRGGSRHAGHVCGTGRLRGVGTGRLGGC